MQKPVYYVSKSLQDFARGRGPLLAVGESHFDHRACYKEAPSLLSGAYGYGPHPTPFVVITSKV